MKTKNFILQSIKTFSYLLIAISILSQGALMAQGVAVNTNSASADASAMLDVSSTNSGMLVPRMTEAERNAIAAPANSLLIFNTSTDCFNFFKAGMWWELCGNCIAPQPPAASYNGPLCEGTTLNLSASTVTNAVYSWTGPGGFTSASQNPVLNNINVSQAGTYQVVITVNGCSSVPADVDVVVIPLPSSSFTWDPVSPTASTDISFSPNLGGASYSWTFQTGSPASSVDEFPLVQWSNAGTYDVALTVTQNSCISTTTQQINISPMITMATLNYTGSLQYWTVPAGINTINIEAFGAQGGNCSNQNDAGGLGARMKGDFSVNPGDVLTILVGQQGGSGYCTGGGGGGTFVVNNGTLLIAAGGGGGGGTYNNTPSNVKDATTSNNGIRGWNGNTLAQTAGVGGTSGSGGGCISNSGGGGGGYSGNGGYCNEGGEGKSFLNGGAGGAPGYGGVPANGYGGGYGGGGGGECTWDGAGGGGGYSGGGAGYYYGAGGGGGSYNIGANQNNSSGVQTGHGTVIINF